MHKHLNLVCRRVTGHSYTPAEIAKQEELHQRNLKRIAVLRRLGLDPKYIVGSDQFCIHLFPQGAYKWVRKGEGHVTNLMKEGKRQLTGDQRELQSHVMSQWRLRYYCAFCPHPSAVINAAGSSSHPSGREAHRRSVEGARRVRHGLEQRQGEKEARQSQDHDPVRHQRVHGQRRAREGL